MPPKKQQQGASKKTVEKKKDKLIEDKTFGLKNKKGKKQQQFIKNVTQQVKYGGQSMQKKEAEAYQAKKEKAEREKEKAAMDGLFKPVQTQKVSAGADPKSVLCLFFKQGLCTKGDKCKFSHDLSLEGKAEKRSMYVDAREQEDLEQDTMDKWDEDKLKEVVKKKQNKPKTDIVCKHFLHAIEKGIYGWFWECPSGDKCIYRHALPPGFVFKKQLKEQEELQPQDTITLEELVEKEREELAGSGKSLTKVTLESFLAWKERKLREKKEKAERESSQRKEAYKAGKTHGISGRELFEFNPEFIQGDDEEAGDDDVVMIRREDDDEASAVDVTGMSTVPTTAVPPPGTKSQGASSEQMGSVGGGESGSVAAAATGGGGEDEEEEVPVDESLFTDQGDDPINQEADGGAGIEDEVPVDESLFDIENLDIDDNDPLLTQTQGETKD